MTSWLKATLVGFAVAAVFVAGYRYAACKYQAQIAEIKAEQALAMKEKTNEYRAKEQSQARQLADAWDRLERARAESVDLRDDVERVRNLADSYRARMPPASASSCKHFAVRLDRCVGLLSEGSGLAAEGAEISQRVSGKHDALARMHK